MPLLRATVLAFALLCAAAAVARESPVKHVVLLQLENRSFDQLLGHLRGETGRHDVDGLTGAERIPVDVFSRHSRLARVSFDQPPHIEFNPMHSGNATLYQMYGDKPWVRAVPAAACRRTRASARPPAGPEPR